MKSPAEMLLKILINGGTVQDGEHKIGMADDYSVGVVVGAVGEELVMKLDMDVRAFVQMAERIGRDELWLKLCAMELKK